MAYSAKILFSTLMVVLLARDAAAGGASADTLIEMAIEYGAPFAQTALERLHGNIFGTGRATRSTDAIIFNKSSKTFKLESTSCDHGGWSTDMFPVHEIKSKESTVYGNESSGFATGVECSVHYVASDGTWFDVRNDNPYIGGNSMSESYSSSLKLITTLGQGDNNQVRWIVEDN